MDHPTSSAIHNRGERPSLLFNSTEVELSDIPRLESPVAESVGKVNNPNGHAELHRDLSLHTRTENSIRNDRNDDSSLYDTRSDVTVVTRSLKTWDVAALIINKMVRFRKSIILTITTYEGAKRKLIDWNRHLYNTRCGFVFDRQQIDQYNLVGCWWCPYPPLVCVRALVRIDTLILVTLLKKPLSLTVYLEFGAALPYTGGELIYVCSCTLFDFTIDQTRAKIISHHS